MEGTLTVFCTRCGQQNSDESRFCSQCGAQLVRPGDASTVGPAAGSEPADSTSVISSTAFDDAGEAIDASDNADAQDAVEGQFGSMEALPPGSGLLVVKRGPNAGSRFLLDQDVTTAGRHPDSDIFLDDVTVSRRHAEFRRSGVEFSVNDVGSLNGTYLNRERIESSTLAGGDEVQIGKFRLVFLTGSRSGAGRSGDQTADRSAAEGPRSQQ
jgi:pSer/pThr/pTyr-binding forkhead associated (FHA) protein